MESGRGSGWSYAQLEFFTGHTILLLIMILWLLLMNLIV
jgi:hypothetical protein